MPEETIDLGDNPTGTEPTEDQKAQIRSSLGATDVGSAFFTSSNPSAISFPRINADNSVTHRSASGFREDLSLHYNPVLGSTRLLIPWGADGDEIIRVVPNDFVLQDEALDYVTAVEDQLAATVPTSQLVVLNTKLIEAKATTWWAKMGRIIMPIWNDADANKICLKSGSTAGSFANTTTSDGFVTSSGNGSYFNPGVNFAGIGASNSAGVGLTYGALVNGAMENAFGYIAGAYDSGSQYCLMPHDSGNVKNEVGGSGSATMADSARHGVYLASCPGGTGVYRLHRRRAAGEVIASSASLAMPAAPSVNPYFMMGNGLDNTYSMAGDYGAFFMGLGLTSAEATAFTLWIKDLWEGLTSLTLS